MPNTQWHYCDLITWAPNSNMFFIIAKKLILTQQNQTTHQKTKAKM
jgi:hypothetical protein